MNSTICICSFIKDEIEYLDEFLKYHIDLGIDHIFLFEDYNSLSHKEITDKYPDKVTLNNILNIFPENNISRLINEKKCRQPKYLQCGLTYLKQHTDFDWCLVIDTDEYLTLRGSNLTDILNSFKEHEAVTVSWQNYNANGHIFKPDYSRKAIQETYTQKCGTSKNDRIGYTTVKLLFNLNLFNPCHAFNVHLVCPVCKVLKNTDKLYLRHYITKSWEEYVWKLKTRGMFYPEHRDLDDFFDINPDLLPKKNELLKIAEDF